MILLLIHVALLQAVAEPPAAESPRPAEIADLTLLEEVRRIGGRVAELRQERFGRPPLAVRAVDAARDAAAQDQLLRLISPERLAARGRAWADLGLGHVDTPRKLLLTLAADLRGIGLDGSGQRLLLSHQQLTEQDFQSRAGEDSSNFLLMTGVRPDEPAVAHMLMHVLQRARGGGERLEPTTDRWLAARAWAEGEANLVAMRYLFEGMGLADELVQLSLDPSQVLEGRLIPAGIGQLPAVEEALVRFVYIEGYVQAAGAFRSGGWEALRKAMEGRTTTRDLLHADRRPQEKSLTPLGAVQTPRVPGLRLVDEDSLGEQGIVTLVSTIAGKDNLGLLAGEGWVADRISRWEKAGEARGITDWETSWSTPEQAAEFDYSFARALAARFPERPTTQLGEGLRQLHEGERIFRLERRGQHVRILVLPAIWEPKPSGSS